MPANLRASVGVLMTCVALGISLPARGADLIAGAGRRAIDKPAYQERLRAMWLAESIANWTGLSTEGRRTGWVGGPPFLTDSDWNSAPFPEAPWAYLGFQVYSDPWGADDDTDIEYVYLHAMHSRGINRLTPAIIRQEWIAHVNQAIWVSNAAARGLMDRNILPPMTAQAQGISTLPNGALCSEQSLMIDAQLTTEFFGALCPGMPERALEMADMPIRTTASGYAVHAAQFYVVLYALATQVDTTLSGEQQALWFVREARKHIPDTSVSSEVIDFVLSDYLANPDKNNWESTRDKVHQRYQLNAPAAGARYWGWTESRVNLATGLMALLYGQMDFARTVQIGTLSGWDSDNGTATMGGLIGLVQGLSFNKASYAFPPLSDRYWAGRTRDNLPDYLPADAAADDTFSLMAARMMPIVEREVLNAGGKADARTWLLPPGGAGPGLLPAQALLRSPTHRLMLRSANNAVARVGGVALAQSSASAASGWSFGSLDPSTIANGAEHDFRGLELADGTKAYFTTRRTSPPYPAPGALHWISVSYDRPIQAHVVRFITGEIFASPIVGGWCTSVPTIELRIDGVWTLVPATVSIVPGPSTPFAVVDFTLASPMLCTGVRLACIPGGSDAFITVSELDVLGPEPSSSLPTADLNADGNVDLDDLYAAYATGTPTDLNLDGVIDATDADYLRALVRAGEPGDMAGLQR